jgi:hypothetical protein
VKTEKKERDKRKSNRRDGNGEKRKATNGLVYKCA